MASSKTIKTDRSLTFLLILAVLLLGGPTVLANAKELAVVAKKTFPIDAITLDNLKEIYLGQKQIIGGLRLRPVDQRDDLEIKQSFLQALQLSGLVYSTYWNNRLFREGGNSPISAQNSEEVIKTVETVDGAIGYIWLEEAKEASGRIKVLLSIDTGP